MSAFKTTLSALAVAIGMVALSSAASAQTYPNKPVRMIVGFPAGTGPDLIARVVAQKMQEQSPLRIIVDNKPGAGGLIAAQEAARAQPDGYTIMLGEVGQLAIATSSYTKLPYNVERDFLPISHIASSNFVLLTNPEKNPSKTAKELAAWAKAQPKFFMGTFGAGTPGHFGAYMFGEAAGVPAEPVHYKTTGDAIGGLFSGDVPALFASVALAAPNVKAGKMRALAMSGAARSPALPDVPTLKEQGYATLEFASWFGLVAPAKTPDEAIKFLNAEVVKAMNSADTRSKLQDMGFAVTGTSPAEFAKIIKDDTARWGKAVQSTGFKAD
jgi:tripartite-type tricarboxylate transporter receptor subunit TctC